MSPCPGVIKNYRQKPNFPQFQAKLHQAIMQPCSSASVPAPSSFDYTDNSQSSEEIFAIAKTPSAIYVNVMTPPSYLHGQSTHVKSWIDHRFFRSEEWRVRGLRIMQFCGHSHVSLLVSMHFVGKTSSSALWSQPEVCLVFDPKECDCDSASDPSFSALDSTLWGDLGSLLQGSALVRHPSSWATMDYECELRFKVDTGACL